MHSQFVFFVAAALTAAPASAGTIYLTGLNAGTPTVSAVDTSTGTISSQWLEQHQSLGEGELAIALDSTIRTVGTHTPEQGSQYTLGGAYTGTNYTNPLPINGGGGAELGWDATSDGTFNYVMDYSSSGVYRTSQDYSSSSLLFYVPGAYWEGISYDGGNSSLWVSQIQGGDTVADYSLTGTLLSSFSTGHSANVALAYDSSNNTLWLDNQGGTGCSICLEHDSTTGALLGTIDIPVGAPSYLGIYGGEFSQTSSVPDKTPFALVALGVVCILGVTRYFRERFQYGLFGTREGTSPLADLLLAPVPTAGIRKVAARSLPLLLFPFFLSTIALPIKAGQVTVTYSGYVSSGITSETGNGPGTFCFFGPCGISLAGDAFLLIYQFDTSTAAPIGSGSLVKGGSYWSTPSVGSATLSINGFNASLDGNFYSTDYSSGGNDTVQVVQQITSPPNDSLGSANFIATEGLANQNAFTFPGSLTTAYAPTAIDFVPVLTSSYDFVLGFSGSELAYGKFSGPGTVSVSDVSEVPEPQNWSIVMAITIGFALVSLRRPVGSAPISRHRR